MLVVYMLVVYKLDSHLFSSILLETLDSKYLTTIPEKWYANIKPSSLKSQAYQWENLCAKHIFNRAKISHL